MSEQKRAMRPSDVWKRLKRDLTQRDAEGARARLGELRNDQKPAFLWKYLGHCKHEGYAVLDRELAASAADVPSAVFVSAMTTRTARSPRGPLPGYGNGAHSLMRLVVRRCAGALETHCAEWPQTLRHGYWLARGQQGDSVPAAVRAEIAPLLLHYALNDMFDRYDVSSLRRALAIEEGPTKDDRKTFASATRPLPLQRVGALLAPYRASELLALEAPLLAHGTREGVIEWFDTRAALHPAESLDERVAVYARVLPNGRFANEGLEAAAVRLAAALHAQGRAIPEVLLSRFADPHEHYDAWSEVLGALEPKRVEQLCAQAETALAPHYQASLLPVRARFAGCSEGALIRRFEALVLAHRSIHKGHIIRCLGACGDTMIAPLVARIEEQSAKWKARRERAGNAHAAYSEMYDLSTVLVCLRAAVAVALARSERSLDARMLEHLRPQPIRLFGGPACDPTSSPNSDHTLVFLQGLSEAQTLFERMPDAVRADWLLDWRASRAASERVLGRLPWV